MSFIDFLLKYSKALQNIIIKERRSALTSLTIEIIKEELDFNVEKIKELEGLTSKKAGDIIFFHFRRKVSKYLQYSFRDFKIKSEFMKRLREIIIREDICDINEMMTLLKGFKFLQEFNKSFAKFHEYYEYLTYLFVYKTLESSIIPDILSENVNTLHRTSQQSFFEQINEFIKKYAKKTAHFFKQGRFDKRNKDSVLWAKAVSELINPDTKALYKFDSEFRRIDNPIREIKFSNEFNHETILFTKQNTNKVYIEINKLSSKFIKEFPMKIEVLSDKEIEYYKKGGAGHGLYVRPDLIKINPYMSSEGIFLNFVHENLHHAFPYLEEKPIDILTTYIGCNFGIDGSKECKYFEKMK